MRDRTNQEWLADLESSGPARETALADLRAIIDQGLPYALSRWLSPSDPRFADLAEEVIQETLLRVLDHRHTFEGRSKFTTWVHKIAIRIALTELRRKRWKDYSLDEMVEKMESGANPGLLEESGFNPETRTEQADVMARIRRVIDEDLTEKQRTAMLAVAVAGMPIDVVASKMEMKRNALYKLMHDARLRLRRSLAEEGLSFETLITSFEPE